MAELPTFFVMREAVHSVALSHDEGCDCNVCTAARGGDEAIEKLMTDLARKAFG